MLKRFLLSVCLLVLVVQTVARATVLLTGAGKGTAAVPYVGPGDIVSGARVWYGLRGYNAAFAGPAAGVCLPLDVACADVYIVNGVFQLGTVATLGCNDSTSVCTIKTLYDQSGNTNDIFQFTVSKRPKLVISCVNGLPCMTFVRSSSQTMLSSGNVANMVQQWSVSWVGSRTGNTTSAQAVLSDEQVTTYVGYSGSANTAELNAGSSATGTASDSSNHAIQGVANGGSSIVYVDGSSSTSTGGNQDLMQDSKVYVGSRGDSDRYFDGRLMEMGAWPSGFSSGNRSSMNSNQHTYWGF